MSQTYEVVLTQKVKKIVSTAITAADAVEIAMTEVEKDAQLFTPVQWTVKEKKDD